MIFFLGYTGTLFFSIVKKEYNLYSNVKFVVHTLSTAIITFIIESPLLVIAEDMFHIITFIIVVWETSFAHSPSNLSFQKRQV